MTLLYVHFSEHVGNVVFVSDSKVLVWWTEHHVVTLHSLQTGYYDVTAPCYGNTSPKQPNPVYLADVETVVHATRLLTKLHEYSDHSLPLFRQPRDLTMWHVKL